MPSRDKQCVEEGAMSRNIYLMRRALELDGAISVVPRAKTVAWPGGPGAQAPGWHGTVAGDAAGVFLWRTVFVQNSEIRCFDEMPRSPQPSGVPPAPIMSYSRSVGHAPTLVQEHM